MIDFDSNVGEITKQFKDEKSKASIIFTALHASLHECGGIRTNNPNRNC